MQPIPRCARPGCGAPATATLSYHYASRTAWLHDVGEEVDPSRYALCAAHADRLQVPVGWTREDRRSAARPLFHVPLRRGA